MDTKRKASERRLLNSWCSPGVLLYDALREVFYGTLADLFVSQSLADAHGCLFAGIGVGAVLMPPIRAPGGSRAATHVVDSPVVAILRAQAQRSRVHAMLQPTWETRAELLRHLCALREAEWNVLTNWDQRVATPAELAPTLEQQELLDLLGRGADTRARRDRFSNLLHRAVEMPAIAHGEPPG